MLAWPKEYGKTTENISDAMAVNTLTEHGILFGSLPSPLKAK